MEIEPPARKIRDRISVSTVLKDYSLFNHNPLRNHNYSITTFINESSNSGELLSFIDGNQLPPVDWKTLLRVPPHILLMYVPEFHDLYTFS